MRNRDEILESSQSGYGSAAETAIAEVLLDIRDTLIQIREELSIIRRNTRKERDTNVITLRSE